LEESKKKKKRKRLEVPAFDPRGSNLMAERKKKGRGKEEKGGPSDSPFLENLF